METRPLKLNLGCGRLRIEGYINIDLVQIIDSKGNACVDKVMDIEKEPLPFKDNTVSVIIVDNVLEHIGDLRFVLNECYRVLIDGGILMGVVPLAGTNVDFKDPTHKRHFVKETFGFFCGEAGYDSTKPKHPKYADYGFKQWTLDYLEEYEDLIRFKMIK